MSNGNDIAIKFFENLEEFVHFRASFFYKEMATRDEINSFVKDLRNGKNRDVYQLILNSKIRCLSRIRPPDASEIEKTKFIKETLIELYDIALNAIKDINNEKNKSKVDG